MNTFLEQQGHVKWLDLCCGEGNSCLRFQISSLVNWKNEDQYDLITCVHGLHYIGDKLKVLAQGLRSVNDQGLFMANLDLNNIKIEGEPRGQYLRKSFIENEINIMSGRS